MTTSVVHIVESTKATGTVGDCLPGLMDALEPLGYDGVIVDDVVGPPFSLRNAGLIHIHGWDFPPALQAARFARKNNKPFVISPLGALSAGPCRPRNWLDRLRNFFSQRPLLAAASGLTALHETEGEDLRRAGVNANIAILPYGMKFDVQATGRACNDKEISRTLLMLDPLEPQYGCVMLLKAFAELGTAADGWSVTLAGEDRRQWRPKLEAAIRRKGGETRVLFRPATSTLARSQLLSNATVFVCPALHIAPPVSIMQAVNALVPVLATRPATPPGVNGEMRVCGAERGPLREALHDLLAMPDEQRRAMAQQAREKACKLFDWSVLAPRYAELYATCLQD